MVGLEFVRGRLLFNGDDQHDPETESLIIRLCQIPAWRIIQVVPKRKAPVEGAPISGYVDMQLVNLFTGESAYCQFNVEIRRQRTRGKHKAGDLYRNKKQFWLGDGHALAKLLRACGIEPINGMGDAWQYLGRLKNLVVTAPAPIGREKLKSTLLHPLSMSVLPVFLTDKPPISDRYVTDT
ncbi:hypothetical protein [Microbulbifer sp. MCCC 1A16149]|uniref:hypothetical protein n=1 Tax=Microbulbifer sp. MCCC 1A16149 TaxID=3411322 RepID=UPI003D106EB5